MIRQVLRAVLLLAGRYWRLGSGHLGRDRLGNVLRLLRRRLLWLLRLLLLALALLSDRGDLRRLGGHVGYIGANVHRLRRLDDAARQAHVLLRLLRLLRLLLQLGGRVELGRGGAPVRHAHRLLRRGGEGLLRRGSRARLIVLLRGLVLVLLLQVWGGLLRRRVLLVATLRMLGRGLGIRQLRGGGGDVDDGGELLVSRGLGLG